MITNNLSKQLLYILTDAIDIEEIDHNKLLIIKNNKKILLNNISEDIKNLCYEKIGENILGKPKKNQKKIIWSDQDIKFLTENKNLNVSSLSQILGKSKYQVNYMMGHLNLFNKRAWSNDEINFLKEHLDSPLIWVSENLNRSISSVKAKRRILKNKISTKNIISCKKY